MLAERLTSALKRANIPIHGVSIGQLDDRKTWRVDYDNATAAQKTAGKAIVKNYNPNAADSDFAQERAETLAAGFNYRVLIALVAWATGKTVPAVRTKLKTLIKSNSPS